MTFATSIVGIITAVASVILAITGLIAALRGLVPMLRTVRVTAAEVTEVHQIVNQQRTDLIDALLVQRRREKVLVAALAAHGVIIPAEEDEKDGLYT